MTKERCYKSIGGYLFCMLDKGHIGFHHYHIYDDPKKCIAVWDDNGMILKGVLNYDGPGKDADRVYTEPSVLSETL